MLNYRIDAVIRTFGERPDWKKYYRDLYKDDAAGWQATQKAIAGFAETSKTIGAKIVVFHLPELRGTQALPVRRGHREGAQGSRGKRHAVRRHAARGREHGSQEPVGDGTRPASLNGKADTAFAEAMVKELLPILDELCRTRQKGCAAK